jgi:hypothetical protein
VFRQEKKRKRRKEMKGVKRKNIPIFDESFFKLLASTNSLFSAISKKVKAEDYYNSDHLSGPLDSFNKESLTTIREVVSLRKRLSARAIKNAKFFALQLDDLYESDSKKGKEAICFLLQLFDGQEIKHIRHAVIWNIKYKPTRAKIAKDFSDLLLFGRILPNH